MIASAVSRYLIGMRQLITRIDDDLHSRLHARARAEGRSVASLVREILSAAVEGQSDRDVLRARLTRSGLVLRPDAPVHVRTRDDVLSLTRGGGKAASAALAAERSARR